MFILLLFLPGLIDGTNTSLCYCNCSKDDLPEVSKQSIINIPSDYERQRAPVNNANKPLNISVKMKLWAIREVSADTMDMEVDMYIYFTWADYRIKINEKLLGNASGQIPLGENGLHLWHPFVQFRNCKGCKPLNLDHKTFLIHWDTTIKKFWTVIRVLEKFSCNINLRGYPMDEQTCRIQLENYYEDISQVNLLHDSKGPFDVMSNMSLSDFKIDKIEARDCKAVYGTKSIACMELLVYLSRFMGYHLTTTYAPTTFIVFISWISFWLPANIAPARITLGITSLLTLATRLDQSQRNLPPVSYAKAVDIWMFACIFLVFASLIEFALAFYSVSFGGSTTTTKVKPTSEMTGNDAPSQKKQDDQPPKNSSAQRTTGIDTVSRILFPVSFLVFNIIYWSYFLT